ncbi:MAG: hypothetical protein ACFE0Q_12195 [Anaerolineae bacterium]
MTDNNPQEIGVDGQALVDEYRAYRRFGAYLVLFGFLTLIVGLTVSTLLAPAPLVNDKLGVHLLLDDGRNRWDNALWADHLAYAGQISSEGGIAVQVIRSDDLDAEHWQTLLDLSVTHQLTPVLRLATTFDQERGWWSAPERDADGSYQSWGMRYADFLNALTWHDDAKHVILLNEPNNGHEWSGAPDPGAYADFVADVAPILREQVEGLVLLNGAFDLHAPDTNGDPFPDSEVAMISADRFMQAMEDAHAGIFDHFDIWSSHPYPLDFRAHPNEQVYRFDMLNGASPNTGTPPDDVFNRGINGYAWELWQLAQLGYDQQWQVMITETGWRHNNPLDLTSADGGEGYPSPAQIATYYELALRGGDGVSFTPWLRDARVIAVAPFALNGVPDEWSHSNLVAVAPDGTISATYAHFDALATIAEGE